MASSPDSARKKPEVDPGLFTAGYKPLPGIFDEMMDADGKVRAHWQPLLAMFAKAGSEEINRRFAAADRYLRDSGVFYRVYEDPAGVERSWPLSHVPLLIEPAEWKALEEGLIQRAGLLEAVIADAYGPAQFIKDGRLPAALVAGNPEFLRPLVGVEPSGGAHLRFYAVDVGRGADGRWWVLNDRTQAPSGAGYAIENRLALARAMPDIYRATRVERVAPFFQAFQAELASFNTQDDTRVCLLTPGPLNETYFEHAYLARYLGLLLVEGEDLTVRDDGVYIRTVSGLRRAEVLLRRLDADFADPLELNAASRLGVAGLVQAVRDGKVTIVNALGVGLVEARAMLAFLPALAPQVLGTELAMPNVATWWLGRPDIRAAMMDKLDSMVVAPAFTSYVPNVPLGDGVLAGDLDERQRAELMQGIDGSRRRLCAAGSRDALDHAGLARRQAAAAAVHAAPVPRQARRPLADDARRLRAHRRQRRCPRRQPAKRRRHRRYLGAGRRTGRRDDAAADARAHAHPARDRRAAEPRRRQPVLGRPLSRARRGDAAAGARPHQPRRRIRRGGDAGHRQHPRPARRLGRRAGRRGPLARPDRAGGADA